MQTHSSDTSYHVSVLAREVRELFAPKPGQLFIDATLGGGGHTRLLAETGAKILALDQDQDAIAYAKTWQASYPNVTVVKGSFEHIASVAQAHGFGRVHGILFDLGVSLYQLKTPERGFSFNTTGPLDMRMDKALGVTAQDLINALPEKQLASLFLAYGEEPKARAIAQAIVRSRQHAPLTTTTELADLATQVIGSQEKKTHPATRVFQALRIAVNTELDALREALAQLPPLLEPEGKVAVISFHSLEDRIVKRQFANWAQQQLGHVLTKRPIVPSIAEQRANRNARSAKMRVFIKQ